MTTSLDTDKWRYYTAQRCDRWSAVGERWRSTTSTAQKRNLHPAPTAQQLRIVMEEEHDTASIADSIPSHPILSHPSIVAPHPPTPSLPSATPRSRRSSSNLQSHPGLVFLCSLSVLVRYRPFRFASRTRHPTPISPRLLLYRVHQHQHQLFAPRSANALGGHARPHIANVPALWFVVTRYLFEVGGGEEG